MSISQLTSVWKHFYLLWYVSAKSYAADKHLSFDSPPLNSSANKKYRKINSWNNLTIRKNTVLIYFWNTNLISVCTTTVLSMVGQNFGNISATRPKILPANNVPFCSGPSLLFFSLFPHFNYFTPLLSYKYKAGAIPSPPVLQTVACIVNHRATVFCVVWSF